jgi:anti-sigma factor ChrR (cupin superfamily)
MLINADFFKRAIICPNQYAWTESPQIGVERVMLDRIGGEKARATSIVRYAKGSRFPKHLHPGGEEILVLSGIFSEHGHDYPEGWYLRNPPGSFHQPYSNEGATIFVKLWQMCPQDTATVRINTLDPTNWTLRGGKHICLLFASESETVWLERLKPKSQFSTQSFYGTEILVVSGEITFEFETYPAGSWIRLPVNDTPEFLTGDFGACVYVKTGYLLPNSTNLKEQA